MEAVKGIKVSHNVAEAILDRKLFKIDTHKSFKPSETVPLIDESNGETVCEILIINKNMNKKVVNGKIWQYNFLISSTEEEKRLLEKRLKALGYL